MERRTPQERAEDISAWLRGQLAERQGRNRRYSMRALARALDLSPSYLSRLMNGTRPLTLDAANQICSRLGVDEKTRAWLTQEGERVKGGGLSPLLRDRGERAAERKLSDDEFHSIADWYHYVIFCLADLPEHSARPEWIASRLRITAEEAEAALRRLERLGVLEVKDGKLLQRRAYLASPNDIASVALKHFHGQNLRRAEASLQRDAPEIRDITSYTVAIDPRHLPTAKRILANFRRRLGRYLESGERKVVYTLAIQLFPAESGPANEPISSQGKLS